MPKVTSRVPFSQFAKKTVKCPGCLATVTYYPVDVKGGGHSPEHIICPDCSHNIEVENDF